MSNSWPDLDVLELFVAVVDSGSLGAGARKVGMAQPNASRAVALLEARLKTSLLHRTPRGSAPTEVGVQLAEQARILLDAAQRFSAWEQSGVGRQVEELRVGASMTIAETLLPAWLSRLRTLVPRVRVDVKVGNSEEILQQVQQGALQLGFVETPHLPQQLNTLLVQQDALRIVVGPHHPWAERSTPVSLAELAATPLVLRESGSGNREALTELLAGWPLAEPAQVLSSNSAVRVAAASGAGPAALSELAVHAQLASGELLSVPFQGQGVARPLSAVWGGPRRLNGLAAQLVDIARAQS